MILTIIVGSTFLRLFFHDPQKPFPEKKIPQKLAVFMKLSNEYHYETKTAFNWYLKRSVRNGKNQLLQIPQLTQKKLPTQNKITPQN